MRLKEANFSGWCCVSGAVKQYCAKKLAIFKGDDEKKWVGYHQSSAACSLALS